MEERAGLHRLADAQRRGRRGQPAAAHADRGADDRQPPRRGRDQHRAPHRAAPRGLRLRPGRGGAHAGRAGQRARAGRRVHLERRLRHDLLRRPRRAAGGGGRHRGAGRDPQALP